jgi:hypothetical protein
LRLWGGCTTDGLAEVAGVMSVVGTSIGAMQGVTSVGYSEGDLLTIVDVGKANVPGIGVCSRGGSDKSHQTTVEEDVVRRNNFVLVLRRWD